MFSRVAQRVVHRVDEGVHGGRLVVARDHEAVTGVRAEIVHHGRHPAPRGPRRFPRRPIRIRPVPAAIIRASPSISPARRLSRWSACAPVSVGVLSMTYSRFMLPGSFSVPAGSEVPRIPDGTGAGGQEVSVEGQDHVRFLDVAAGGTRFRRRASREPSLALSSVTGSYWCHRAPGCRASRASSCPCRAGEVTVPVSTRIPPPCFSTWLDRASFQFVQVGVRRW